MGVTLIMPGTIRIKGHTPETLISDLSIPLSLYSLYLSIPSIPHSLYLSALICSQARLGSRATPLKLSIQGLSGVTLVLRCHT